MTCPQLLAEPSDSQLAFFSILCPCAILAPLRIASIPNPELETGNCSSSVVSPLYGFGHYSVDILVFKNINFWVSFGIDSSYKVTKPLTARRSSGFEVRKLGYVIFTLVFTSQRVMCLTFFSLFPGTPFLISKMIMMVLDLLTYKVVVRTKSSSSLWI